MIAASSTTGSENPTPYFESAWVISAAKKRPSGMPIAAPIRLPSSSDLRSANPSLMIAPSSASPLSEPCFQL